eukprot:gene26313-17407_t
MNVPSMRKERSFQKHFSSKASPPSLPFSGPQPMDLDSIVASVVTRLHRDKGRDSRGSSRSSSPAKGRVRFQLMDEERQRLMREGRCFDCKELGHKRGSPACRRKKKRGIGGATPRGRQRARAEEWAHDTEDNEMNGFCHASLRLVEKSRQRAHYMDLDHYERRELAARYGPLVDVQGFTPQDFEEELRMREHEPTVMLATPLMVHVERYLELLEACVPKRIEQLAVLFVVPSSAFTARLFKGAKACR